MTVQKLSTRSFFASSRLLNRLALAFEKDRNVTNLVLLMAAISDSEMFFDAHNDLMDYLEQTAGDTIHADYSKFSFADSFQPPPKMI